MESFYLAVNPHDPADDGFLGGTLLGREFWRGHRGCGAPGARAFQLFCQKAGQALTTPVLPPPPNTNTPHSPLAPSVPPSPYPQASTSAQPISAGNASAKKGPAGTVRAEVYVTVRNAIRSVASLLCLPPTPCIRCRIYHFEIVASFTNRTCSHGSPGWRRGTGTRR